MGFTRLSLLLLLVRLPYLLLSVAQDSLCQRALAVLRERLYESREAIWILLDVALC
jgi:hypothetical protein